jgi:hypothetical protein
MKRAALIPVAILLALPGVTALSAQVAIWLIPGCNPNPYAIRECMVAGVNFATPLLFALLGGGYIFLLLFAVFVCIGIPAAVIAWLFDRRRRNGHA